MNLSYGLVLAWLFEAANGVALATCEPSVAPWGIEAKGSFRVEKLPTSPSHYPNLL